MSWSNLGMSCLNFRIWTMYQALGWIWFFLLLVFLCCHRLGTTQPNSVHFYDSASAVLNYVIHLMMWQDQLGQSCDFCVCVLLSLQDMWLWDGNAIWVEFCCEQLWEWLTFFFSVAGMRSCCPNVSFGDWTDLNSWSEMKNQILF